MIWTILALTSFHSGSNESLFTFSTTTSTSEAEQLPFPESARKLWRQLLPMLEDAAPGVQSPTIAQGTVSVYWHPNEELDMVDRAVMHHQDVLKMARQHRRFTTEMSTRIPAYIPTYQAEKRGIVTVAGGDYLPTAIVTLRMLRRTGSTLPVEIWMADESEYEPEICESILPTYNARCRLLSDVFSPPNSTNSTSESNQPPPKIAHFQYKIFAILFSTFEEVLFIDSDNIPLQDPRALFDSALFAKHGMISWPDLWALSTSPIYYLIADQPAPANTVRASTESGQLLVNKRTHFETLLLAAYYNYYGPDHYYLLLCTGGYGRGDKSTFLPAALAMNQSFYDVSERPVAIGQDFEWLHVFALLQFDPLEDHVLTSAGIYRNKNKTAAPPIRPFFLHGNDPKWNGERIFSNADEWSDDDSTPRGFRNNPTRNPQGERSWAYVNPVDVIDYFSIRAIERQLWEQTRWVSCELEHVFEMWRDKSGVCARVEAWFDEFLDTEAADRADEQDRIHDAEHTALNAAMQDAEKSKQEHADMMAAAFGRIAKLAGEAAKGPNKEVEAQQDIKKILKSAGWHVG